MNPGTRWVRPLSIVIEIKTRDSWLRSEDIACWPCSLLKRRRKIQSQLFSTKKIECRWQFLFPGFDFQIGWLSTGSLSSLLLSSSSLLLSSSSLSSSSSTSLLSLSLPLSSCCWLFRCCHRCPFRFFITFCLSIQSRTERGEHYWLERESERECARKSVLVRVCVCKREREREEDRSVRQYFSFSSSGVSIGLGFGGETETEKVEEDRSKTEKVFSVRARPKTTHLCRRRSRRRRRSVGDSTGLLLLLVDQSSGTFSPFSVFFLSPWSFFLLSPQSTWKDPPMTKSFFSEHWNIL